MRPKLLIFDVDGTLVDSAAHIERVMAEVFVEDGLEPPAPGSVRALIGVSLPGLLHELRPDLPDERHDRLAHAYMRGFAQTTAHLPVEESAPLFPGTLEMLESLHRRDDLLLGIATGKSRRGLDRLLTQHGIEQLFWNKQVSDNHPSKPNPSMVLAALSETGIEAEDAILVGDTSFDLQMARAAGVRAIGVSWGNHAPTLLARDADHMISSWPELEGFITKTWGAA